MMSDYSMDIKGNMELSDYSNIFDYLNIIDKDDNFVIRIDKNNKNDIDLINSMLKDNKFMISYTQCDEYGNYYISANKMF
ncbi:hypothetical protein CLSAP_53070 [Clostridium saccharoperbutylacetonicum]|uniref:Uncharacterized protein n=2 Tax=Clostridiaceae TaxID=31979 RepID=M1M161_9CLOT|nr:hypothetical protein Cspa_c55580 [Clostridium saccharoperbutylacetonicum N1-4(HMT)]AQR97971.1 hypothetical protein CLSAP_53070 [Clostridium saccharoperbutylacetonicum]NSB23224.1 hypothetical protein [Clostridium saccharoperbutylacetonicum]NSB33864.1 hypothetical protein [Clostridium saccharoperbutylacetonicum]